MRSIELQGKIIDRVIKIFQTHPDVQFNGKTYTLGPDGEGQARISVVEIEDATEEWFLLTLEDFKRMAHLLRKENEVRLRMANEKQTTLKSFLL